MRRAARLGDGWIGAGGHDPESIKRRADELAELRKQAGRDHLPFEITVGSPAAGAGATLDMVKAARDAGAQRVVVSPPWPPEGRLSVQYVQDFMQRTGEEIIAKLD